MPVAVAGCAPAPAPKVRAESAGVGGGHRQRARVEGTGGGYGRRVRAEGTGGGYRVEIYVRWRTGLRLQRGRDGRSHRHDLCRSGARAQRHPLRQRIFAAIVHLDARLAAEVVAVLRHPLLAAHVSAVQDGIAVHARMRRAAHHRLVAADALPLVGGGNPIDSTWQRHRRGILAGRRVRAECTDGRSVREAGRGCHDIYRPALTHKDTRPQHVRGHHHITWQRALSHHLPMPPPPSLTRPLPRPFCASRSPTHPTLPTYEVKCDGGGALVCGSPGPPVRMGVRRGMTPATLREHGACNRIPVRLAVAPRSLGLTFLSNGGRCEANADRRFFTTALRHLSHEENRFGA